MQKGPGFKQSEKRRTSCIVFPCYRTCLPVFSPNVYRLSSLVKDRCEIAMSTGPPFRGL